MGIKRYLGRRLLETSCLLHFKLRNFESNRRQGNGRCPREVCIGVLHASSGRMKAFYIQQSVGFLRCLSCLMGNAKA